MDFTPVPINFDPVTKHLSLSSTSSPDDPLATALSAVNTLHRDLINLNADVPPPPNQINGRLTEQVRKLKDSGNQAFKRTAYADAIRMYTLAIEMALKRPAWEAAGYQREEICLLYSNRAQAYMSTAAWGEALADSEAAIFLKRSFTKAHYRKGKCLQNMGRLRDAKDAYELGLESGATAEGGSEAELKTALAEVEELMRQSGN
ncbi:hypothetical protein BZA70DRAFT_123071 [Myxozyma melibiosi]|uniref:Translocation protein sec72 n=1 Tax=Myxozyma melibiosi TaxID=54550 RepID=A0ABR1F880_9ASCO